MRRAAALACLLVGRVAGWTAPSTPAGALAALVPVPALQASARGSVRCLPAVVERRALTQANHCPPPRVGTGASQGRYLWRTRTSPSIVASLPFAVVRLEREW